jgi:hypothetical protein
MALEVDALVRSIEDEKIEEEERERVRFFFFLCAAAFVLFLRTDGPHSVDSGRPRPHRRYQRQSPFHPASSSLLFLPVLTPSHHPLLFDRP